MSVAYTCFTPSLLLQNFLTILYVLKINHLKIAGSFFKGSMINGNVFKDKIFNHSMVDEATTSTSLKRQPIFSQRHP